MHVAPYGRNYSDTSDSDTDLCTPSFGHIVKGYDFEPKINATRNIGASKSNIKAKPAPVPRRLGTVEWCTCKQCIILQHPNTDKDCICCREMNALKSFGLQAGDCFANNIDFQAVSMNPVVLKNVLICLNSVRMDQWRLDPPTHRQEYLLTFAIIHE